MNCERFKFSSYAECDNRSIIVCKQKAKEYVLENSFKEEICKVEIDKGYIPSPGKLCDYLVVICPKNIAIFVELKGEDYKTACSQIFSTIQSFISEIKKTNCIVLARVVAQSIPNIKPTSEMKLEKLLKELNKGKAIKCKVLDRKSKKFYEKITRIIG
jgi:hypothetical protein